MVGNFETALDEVLIAVPLITACLASIGLATIAYLLWSGFKPIIGYLTSGPKQMLSFWCYALAIFGGGALGYSQNELRGMWQGLGIVSLAGGILTVIFHWIRQWILWYWTFFGDKKMN